jgi:bifunctional DNA-binding transcriptional regulator/antitoxin component of YhaV-PrlF toxin-antitoxin module
MELVKLGKKGQVSIPKSILRKAGITGEMPMVVHLARDGAIVLRQVGVYPIEIYSEERIREFDEADTPSPEQAKKLRKKLR